GRALPHRARARGQSAVRPRTHDAGRHRHPQPTGDHMALTGPSSPQRRHRPRANERGAALFIVVLVVVLLTAIGTFAVHVPRLAQLASGYSRRAASAFYLGEFAMNIVAANLANDPRGHVQQATYGQDTCRSVSALAPLQALNTPRFCEVKDSNN